MLNKLPTFTMPKYCNWNVFIWVIIVDADEYDDNVNDDNG